MPFIRNVMQALILAVTPLLSHAEDITQPYRLLPLQPHATIQKSITHDGSDVELINLNPSIGRWLLLKIQGNDKKEHWLHLDLGQEGLSKATLNRDGNIFIEPRDGAAVICRLDTLTAREDILKKHLEPFTSICSGTVFIRSKPEKGYKSNLESVTDWLREQGPIGEKVITWKKDLFPHEGDPVQVSDDNTKIQNTSGPAPAEIIPGSPAKLSTVNIGFKLETHNIANGTWLPVLGAPGVWVSMTAASFVPTISPDHKSSNSLAYFMAIELNSMDPRYSVGVDHPSVAWSTRAPGPHETPGPDGFSTLEPLRRVGMVPPWAMNQLTAVIAGGFKREHSAFKAGPFSTKNHGSHYGFAEAGVVLSKIQPGLMTFFQRLGEQPQLKIWDKDEEVKGTDKLIFARQNGLALIENGSVGSDTGISFTGNWSGNQDGSPETMRSSLCVTEHKNKNYLIYGVYSKAVPKDMAQILKAYQCKNAMQMDMNAPALTYAAVVTKDDKGIQKYIPLLGTMDDKNFGGTGRFTNTPDTRDFIYFDRK